MCSDPGRVALLAVYDAMRQSDAFLITEGAPIASGKSGGRHVAQHFGEARRIRQRGSNNRTHEVPARFHPADQLQERRGPPRMPPEMYL
jgi:hypothetical protein